MKIVRVLSGGAAQGLVEALRPSFEATTGAAVDGVFGAVGAMQARLLSHCSSGLHASRNGHRPYPLVRDNSRHDTALNGKIDVEPFRTVCIMNQRLQRQRTTLHVLRMLYDHCVSNQRGRNKKAQRLPEG